MSKFKDYHIIKTATKTSIAKGSYEVCLNVFNIQDKIFKKTHKLISDEEYQKILKKKPNK